MVARFPDHPIRRVPASADDPDRKDVTIGVPPAAAGAEPVGDEEDEEDGDDE